MGTLRLHLLFTALVLLVPFAQAPAAETACQCHDRPDRPCIQENLYLEKITFPAYVDPKAADKKKDIFRANLDEGGTSDVWLLVQVVPNGACKDCEQTYLAYLPNLDTDTPSSVPFELNPLERGASDLVFSMVECSPRSGYTITIAMLEHDGSYSSDFGRISPFLSPVLVLGESGDATRSSDRAWSARLQGEWLRFLFGLLNDGTNDVILCAETLASPPPSSSVAANYADTEIVYTAEKDCDPERKAEKGIAGSVTIQMGASSFAITPCSLRCSDQEPRTQAEKHFDGRKRCDLSAVADTVESDGSTYELKSTGQKGVPANARFVETTVKRFTREEPDGSTVEFVQVVEVIRFEDGSIHVSSYVRQTVRKDGETVSNATDCLQATSLSGFDRFRLSALTEFMTKSERTYTVWGGSPSVPLVVPPDLATAPGEVPEQIELIAAAGARLDLTLLTPSADATGVTSSALRARSSITIHADAMSLPEGTTLESLMEPDPIVFPGVSDLLVLVPEAVPITTKGDTVLVLVVNRSARPDVVTLRSVDSRGWIQPETSEMELAAGEVSIVTLRAFPPDDAQEATSLLFLTAATERLGTASARTELVFAAPKTSAPPATGAPSLETETGGPIAETQAPPGEPTPPAEPTAPTQPASPAPTAPSPTVPEDVQEWARLLAWKGGWLGRTNPSERWDAREDQPGEACLPCGGAPMCVVCMESDLQAWQTRRKTLQEMVSLMSLLAYLSQIAHQPEYYMVAALYWEAHWDGWHNRNAP